MTCSTRLVRYSARKALQKYSNSASSGNDFGTDYHVSEESEHSEVETAEGPIVEEGTSLQDPRRAEEISDSPQVVRRGRGRSRGRGLPSIRIRGPAHYSVSTINCHLCHMS